MSVKNFQRIMRAALFTPTRSGWGLPLLFWGRPGVGKSDIIESTAEAYGFPCEVLSPGERGEGAFGVTPVPNSDGYLSYPPPDWTQKFGQDGGLVFLDEINTAAPAIQSAMMGLLLKRRIGGHTLPPTVRILGAANDVVDAAGGWDLAPPVANRLGHLVWEAPSETEWTDWLMTNVDDQPKVTATAASVQAKVTEDWPAAWAGVRGLVAGFIRSKPDALHKQPAAGSPDASKAWPSHRSWEFATRALASSRCHGLSEADGDLFASAFVGSGVLGELVAYRASADLPDPTQLLAGAIKWAPDFKRLDRTYAVLNSCTSLLQGQLAVITGGKTAVEKDAKLMARLNVFIDLMGKTAAKAKDLVWKPATMLAKAGLHDLTPATRKLMGDDMRLLVQGVET